MKRHCLILFSMFFLLAAGGIATGSPTTQNAGADGGKATPTTQRADSRQPTTASDDAAARKFSKFTDLTRRLLAVATTGWDGLDDKLAAMEEEYATVKPETEPARLCSLAKDVMETTRGLLASQQNFEKLRKLYLLGQIQEQMFLASRDDVRKHVDRCGIALTAFVAEAKRLGLLGEAGVTGAVEAGGTPIILRGSRKSHQPSPRQTHTGSGDQSRRGS